MSPPDPNADDHAIGVTPDDAPPLVATVELCYYCFDMLLAHLSNSRKKKEVPSFPGSYPASAECPLFVTWDKARHRRTRPPSSYFGWLGGGNPNSSGDLGPCVNDDRYQLRGCIGTLAPRSLRTALGEFALTSALRDRRFGPICSQEVPQLRVTVSLLVNYEGCSNCLEWTVGVHGVIIAFAADGSEYSATYLPEVAAEQR